MKFIDTKNNADIVEAVAYEYGAIMTPNEQWALNELVDRLGLKAADLANIFMYEKAKDEIRRNRAAGDEHRRALKYESNITGN